MQVVAPSTDLSEEEALFDRGVQIPSITLYPIHKDVIFGFRFVDGSFAVCDL